MKVTVLIATHPKLDQQYFASTLASLGSVIQSPKWVICADAHQVLQHLEKKDTGYVIVIISDYLPCGKSRFAHEFAQGDKHVGQAVYARGREIMGRETTPFVVLTTNGHDATCLGRLGDPNLFTMTLDGAVRDNTLQDLIKRILPTDKSKLDRGRHIRWWGTPPEDYKPNLAPSPA